MPEGTPARQTTEGKPMTTTTETTETETSRCPSCGAPETVKATPGCTDPDGCNG
jgi:hypothetical protein